MLENDFQASGWFNNVTGTTCAVSIFEALSKKNITWKNVSDHAGVESGELLTHSFKYYETDIIDAYMYKVRKKGSMARFPENNRG